MSSLHAMMYGATAMASAIASLLLLRFWKSVADRLFLFWAAGFAVLAIDWVAIALVDRDSPSYHYLFAVRLFAFALIVVGIIDKNRRHPPA